MSAEKMLEECRAHWEKTKPDAVFADYWLGWKASRESLVIELPAYEVDVNPDDDDYELMEQQEALSMLEHLVIGKCRKAIEAAGLKVK